MEIAQVYYNRLGPPLAVLPCCYSVFKVENQFKVFHPSPRLRVRVGNHWGDSGLFLRSH